MLSTKIMLTCFALRYPIIASCLLSVVVLAYITFVDSTAPLILLQGSSMIPTLKAGDLLFVYRNYIAEVKVGDIVAANIISGGDNKLAKNLYVHRVIERTINDGGFVTLTTKGDALAYSDKEQVTDGNYVGSVYFVIPRVASVGSVLTNPIVVGSIAVGVIGYFVYLRLQRGSK